MDAISMSTLNIFGAAVTFLMMIFYFLEDKNSLYTLLFGFSCLLASLYGFLAGTWPFGVIECLWGMLSLIRWIKVRNN